MPILSQEAYEIAKNYIGLAEIEGKVHQPKIVLFHSFTSLKAQDDETPWCSSFMNFCVLMASYKRNPMAVQLMLKDMGFKQKIIDMFIKEANVEVPSLLKEEEIIQPTWSAWARSWGSWGVSCLKNPKIGDIAVFRRGKGGHVGFIHHISDMGNFTILGGNQDNSVNTKHYSRVFLLDIRRSRK